MLGLRLTLLVVRRYVPTGFQSKELIVKAGLNLGDVDQFPNIDVTIDGADEVDVSVGFQSQRASEAEH